MNSFFFILILTFGSNFCFASNHVGIQPSMIQFHYVQFDGSESLNCNHTLQNSASQDWLVTCGPKKYTVHLWVTAYTHQTEPHLSYEVLYWINDITIPSQPHGASTTVWFHLKDLTLLSLLQVRLGVENETAELGLDLDPSKK
jgi:hypothetical protein